MIPFKVYQLKIIKRKFMNWFKRLTGGLNKTASGIKNSIGSIFKGNKLDVSKLEDLEDQLISCDIGIDVSEKLVSQLKSEKLNSDASEDEILLKLSSGINKILDLYTNSQVVTFSNCGHWVMIEKTKEFNQYSLNFLKN